MKNEDAKSLLHMMVRDEKFTKTETDAIETAMRGLSYRLQYRWHNMLEKPEVLPKEGSDIIYEVATLNELNERIQPYEYFVGKVEPGWNDTIKMKGNTLKVTAWKYLEKPLRGGNRNGEN